MRYQLIIAIWIVFLLVCAGCVHSRSVSFVGVNDLGAQITTRNRYFIVGTSYDYTKWLTTGSAAEWKYKKLQKFQPNVFSDDGIPVVFSIRKGHADKNWKFPDCIGEDLLCFIYEFPTCFTLPYNFEEKEKRQTYALKVLDSPNVQIGFEIYCKNNSVVSPMTPLALLFYNEDVISGGMNTFKKFENHTRAIGKRACDSETEAEAYGLAVRLKELEDSGQIPVEAWTVAKKQHEHVKGILQRNNLHEMQKERSTEQARVMQAIQHRPVASRYTLRHLAVEPGRDFAYRFELDVANDARSSLDFISEVKSDFQNLILSDYRSVYPNANWQNLRVVFQDFIVEGGKIHGRVVVLSLDIESLVYDANTRHGTLSVRFLPDQFAEARHWITHNIEILARDKNIALVTGQIPPAAKYYSLDEGIIDTPLGHILKINFKTE